MFFDDDLQLLELALDLVDLFGQVLRRLSKDNLLSFFNLAVCFPNLDKVVDSVCEVFEGGTHRCSLDELWEGRKGMMQKMVTTNFGQSCSRDVCIWRSVGFFDKFFLRSAINTQREAFVVPVSLGFQIDARLSNTAPGRQGGYPNRLVHVPLTVQFDARLVTSLTPCNLNSILVNSVCPTWYKVGFCKSCIMHSPSYRFVR